MRAPECRRGGARTQPAARRAPRRRRRHPDGVVELLGWLSSAILLATLVRQVLKQWREGSSEGVSRWLFVGQIAASVGFTAYSALVGNWVFVVTNALILCDAIVGLVIVLHHRRRARARPGARARPAPAGT